MKTISQMIKPRESVFKDTTREDTLNLSDFAEGRIDGKKFFAENFKTQGMRTLFETAFKRFKGESDTGVIKLTQAMGGGKTHNMLALALLAQDASLRKEVLSTSSYDDIGDIKVITFSGRENADYGIWGSIAEQLGKTNVFSEYYSPLKAPGEKAWINLLQGQNILILLDELPPYLENAKATAIGNSDLSKVTITALANLFSALGKEQLSNVCLVFSDLKAAYESGSELLQSSFRELEQEANRIAIEIAPVQLNSDEVYSILRKRLFEDTPATELATFSQAKNDIAIEFKNAVDSAKKLGFTGYSGETVYSGIVDSYPFHPSIKELYARFKENQNFQQTRGLIKLMRQVVRLFFEEGQADKNYLINVFDVNLNNANMMSMFRQIKPSLEEAISHDIAQNGLAIAEGIDKELGSANNSQQLAKLILVSSLSTVPNGLLGLTEQEILGYICYPGADLNALKTCLDELKNQCWYIKTDNRGRLYYQNTKNMIAEMNTLIESYTNENARKELKKILEENFAPKLKRCYELLYVLPAIDEINLDTKKVSLVICEPYGSTLHPDLLSFYDNASLKNRVMFLSGERSMMEKLYDNSKKLAAIRSIVKNMENEGIPTNDQQYQEALSHRDKAIHALFSTIRETFVTIYFPNKNGIEKTEFKLEFKSNRFDGEEQVIQALTEVKKFEDLTSDDIALETLRKKCEKRLFTTKEMTFSTICERAATETSWQWYHPTQLEVLKKDCLSKDKWREIGGYLVKGPFEKDPTSVTVSQTGYNEETQEFSLRVKGIGGRIYYDIGADPTAASTEWKDTDITTKEPYLKFVCIDPTGERKTGAMAEFIGVVPTKHKVRATANGNFMMLQSHPKFEIRYTTDGSEPKENGGVYNGEFLVGDDCKFVRVAVLNNGMVVDEKNIPVDKKAKPQEFKINPDHPVSYKRNQKKKLDDTESVFDELAALSKIADVFIRGGSAYIYERSNEDNYVEFDSNIPYTPSDLQTMIELVRETSFKDRDTVVTLEYKELIFTRGQNFNEWIEMFKLDLEQLKREGDIKQ